jgi:xanthine dehydrogenase accessory factor
LAKFAHALNFTVSVIDPFLRLPELEDVDSVLHALDFRKLNPAKVRYVVVASRGQFDEEAVAEALRAEAEYVALLANRKRAQEIAASLHFQGISKEKLDKLRAPAGLDIGAETPEEIALSIMAEIVSERKKKASAG